MEAPLIVAVTGHRDIVPDEMSGIYASVSEFFSDLKKQFPNLPIQVLSPLAEGAGRLVAKVALEHKIELTIPLPMPQDLYKDDFKTEESRKEFDELCQHGTVIEIPLLPGTSAEDIRSHGEPRTRQYAQLGVFLSSHCHILLAIWDGVKVDRLGGTSSVVNYHLTGEMAGFVNNSPDIPLLLAGNENDLVYQVVCSRKQSPATAEPGINFGAAGFYTASTVLESDRKIPPAYRRMFAQMESFREDLPGTTEFSMDESLIEKHDPYGFDDGARLTNEMFMRVDQLAKVFQRRVQFSLRLIYAFAILLGLSFLGYSDFGNLQIMIWLFLLFFAGGITAYLIADRRDWHRKYLDYRALAEGLRVQFYWHVAGVTESSGTVFVHDNFLQKQDIEVGWIRNVMRFVSLHLAMQNRNASTEGVNYAVQNWIGHGGPSGEGQLAYFEQTANRRTRTNRITRVLGLACLWLGIGIALALAMVGGQLSQKSHTILVALMGAFPLIAAVREAYAHKRADKELIKQYRFMHRLFGNARLRIDQATSDDEKRAILNSLGTAALDEHAEWILMHRERPLEHGKL